MEQSDSLVDPYHHAAVGGRLHVSATLRGTGTILGLLVAEEPARFQEFLREAERLDQPFKRWEYTRGVHGVPGAGADLVGLLPEGLPYTGFEGYWAGSGRSEEEIVTAEAEQGQLIIRHLAELTGTAHALAAGLDIYQHPQIRALVATVLGQDIALANLDQVEPVFGELLARLRATAESYPQPDEYAAFQAKVETATQAVGPSIYRDLAQDRLLIDLAAEGLNIRSEDIAEQYEIPRAPLTSHHANMARLSERERQEYRLLGEIGRMGHPVIRALLHIQDWLPEPSDRRSSDRRSDAV